MMAAVSFAVNTRNAPFLRGFVGVAKDARTWHPDLGQLVQVAAVMGPFCHMEI